MLGQDFTLSGTPGVIVIPAGQTSASITLTAIRDGVTEKQETIILRMVGDVHGKDFVKIAISNEQGGKGKGKGHGR